MFTLLDGLPKLSDSLTGRCTGWLRNKDGGSPSGYLKLLTAVFIVMSTHDLSSGNVGYHTNIHT